MSRIIWLQLYTTTTTAKSMTNCLWGQRTNQNSEKRWQCKISHSSKTYKILDRFPLLRCPKWKASVLVSFWSSQIFNQDFFSIFVDWQFNVFVWKFRKTNRRKWQIQDLKWSGTALRKFWKVNVLAYMLQFRFFLHKTFSR